MYQTPRTLVLIWNELKKNKVFQAGLVFKLLILFLLIPEIQTKWFVHFVSYVIENPSFFSWTNYIAAGESSLAFPYGPTMFLFVFPATFLGGLIDSFFGVNYFMGLGFRLNLLFADILILVTLIKQFQGLKNQLLFFYWLSPLVIVLTYWHGQLDLIPLSLLFLGIGLLKNGDRKVSAIAIALAIAAKHSILVSLPFIIIYLWFKRGIVGGFRQFIYFLIVTLIVLEGFFFFDSGFGSMVLMSSELEKIYWLSINMGGSVKIYVLPLIYLFFVYLTWRMHRMNFDLLIATMGVGFSIFLLLTPASPGWFLWIAPILSLHLSRGNNNTYILGSIFNIVFLIYILIYHSGSEILGFGDLKTNSLFDFQSIKSLFSTSIIGLLSILTIQIYRDGVKGNDFYHLGKKPIVIGVAGRSVVGKSDLSSSLVSLFGDWHSRELSENNYKIWSDESLMWKTKTFSDPGNYDVLKMTSDLRRMVSGLPVEIKESYNNFKLNFFNPKAKLNKYQVILVKGLHAFYSRQLMMQQDVKFYIEIEDEELLANQNGDASKKKELNYEDKVSEIEDAIKFIDPQRENADIIFKLTSYLPFKASSNNIKFSVVIQNGIYHKELTRVLIGVCGLQVNVNKLNHYGNVELEIFGEVSSEDVRLASRIVTPHLGEMIQENTGFKSGINGLMQLIALMEIDEVLKIRKGSL